MADGDDQFTNVRPIKDDEFTNVRSADSPTPTGDVSDPTKGYTPSTAANVGREGALGLFKGLGIPETMNPVSDLAKSLVTPPSGSPAMNAVKASIPGIGLVQGLYDAGKEMFSGEPEGMAHGAGSLLGQGLSLAGLREAGDVESPGMISQGIGKVVRQGPGEMGAGELKPWVKAPGNLFPSAARVPAISNPEWLPEHPNVVRGIKGENFMRVPLRVPSRTSLGSGLRVPEEGIPGTVAKPAGRLVLTPEETRASDRMYQIAKQKAHERGMQFAGGQVPAEGRKVPRYPTQTSDVEMPSRGKVWNPQTEEWEEK